MFDRIAAQSSCGIIVAKDIGWNAAPTKIWFADEMRGTLDRSNATRPYYLFNTGVMLLRNIASTRLVMRRVAEKAPVGRFKADWEQGVLTDMFLDNRWVRSTLCVVDRVWLQAMVRSKNERRLVHKAKTWTAHFTAAKMDICDTTPSAMKKRISAECTFRLLKVAERALRARKNHD